MGEEYTDAVRHLVQRYRETIGEPAIGIARKHDGVVVEDGEVAGFDGGEEECVELIASYADVIGEVAHTIARQVLETEDVDVPEGLERD